MKAIRDNGKNTLKPAQKKDTNRNKDTEKAAGDFMSAIKTELEKRRLGVEPSSQSVQQPSNLSKNISFEATQEGEDDSDFGE